MPQQVLPEVELSRWNLEDMPSRTGSANSLNLEANQPIPTSSLSASGEEDEGNNITEVNYLQIRGKILLHFIIIYENSI